MPVHHLRMLGRHRANYKRQDIDNASVSRAGTTLVHHLQMLAQRRTNNCAEDHPPSYYATCTLTHLQTITDRFGLQ